MNNKNNEDFISLNLDDKDIEILEHDPVVSEYYKNLRENSNLKERTMNDNIANNKEAKVYDVIPSNKDTAIIGIGQCGGNIANKARNEGFLTCAVNTSKEDLLYCKTDFKYEFKNSSGSGKERSRSKNIFAANIDDFNRFFDENFKSIKNVVVVASAAGGTGGGSAPMCARFLKDNYPNKNIFLMIVLGSIYEDIKSQENMLSVLEEISKCEVNYLVFDNDSNNSDERNNDKVDQEVIDAVKFISRQYFVESAVSNIDVVDMQKLYIENKRMIIVEGKFDTKISNKVDLNQQMINAINNSTQPKSVVNPMSYAIFLSNKFDKQTKGYKKLDLDLEFRSLVDEFGEPYEIYKHFQSGPEDAPDFVVCITGLGDCVERYSLINDRVSEFNDRMNEIKKLSDINKVTINARSYEGVTLPEEVEKKDDSVNKSSLDLFM